MRRRLFIAALLASTTFYPAEAHALPVLGFLGGALFSITGIVTPLIGFSGAAAGLTFGTFLTSGFGSLLISVAASAAQYFLQKKPRAPTVESARVNVRIGDPQRWLHGGRSRAGGGAMFGEYDEGGAFWYIIVHGDSPLRNRVAVVLDEIPVDVDEDGYVTTAEFTEELKEGGDPVFRIWTRTFTPDNPIPPPVAEFKAVFPEWTDDHLLVGTTYSVVRCKSMHAEDRYKIMTWRGPFGLGEPGISIIGDWDYVYDPRDPAQDIDDRMTWGTSRNPALIWAWFRTHPYGRNKPLSSINWTKIGEQADICDEAVADKYGTLAPRYVCGISIPDEKERHVAESEILLSADAIIMHDEQGKAYAQVGHYEAPTLTLSRRRDIMAMASREAADGESETDGVIIRYIDPDFNFVAQPAAAWINPNYYVEGRTPRFLNIDVLACQNHRQAVTLAKAMGLRTQSKYRLVPTVGLRGVMARRRRIVDLQYDELFSGPHEIATPVEVDEAGVSAGFGLVPVDADRWTLLPGEEGDKPAPAVPIEHDDDLPYPTGVAIYGAPVPGSGGASVRIEATFDTSPRVDRRYEFQYKKVSETIYRPMGVLMRELLAYSDTVQSGVAYHVQYRTVTTSGRANDWKDPPVGVTPIADTNAPEPVENATSTGGIGEILHAWKAPNSANYFGTQIFVSITNDIGMATLVRIEYGAPSAEDEWRQTGVAPGTWYAWLVSMNGSGVVPATPPVATGPITVT